jgi:di/tricarboxylate transporter
MEADPLSEVGIAKNTTQADGFAWGLASISLGAVAQITATVTLVFNVVLWQADHVGNLPRHLAFPGACLGLLLMFGLAGCSIAFGIRGRDLDRWHRRSAPMALAGILLGVVATILWLIVGIDLLVILYR